ncbi:GNAT family N-acetyltransferase [Microbacterium sp. dk485]|uniref:GNAT family N-acetyltransferase n=1 Tax=Microbacterium sp. dk485 TaxID=2560021 RepID=UPI0010743B75|nr:GNAT family N-acetyltransferase [Microbacterium sp. dk485]TFV80894.1 GNAT family N-acetyltransferase [Microbacterium sp. dk485]
MTVVTIALADLDDPRTRALVSAHLSGMRAASPPESVHALEMAGLQHPDVTLWSAEVDDRIAGIAALSRLDDTSGEIKSMRVDEAFLGRGIGRALLHHVMGAARKRGMTRLWLETGSTDEFLAARRLYESEGFIPCGPFGKYRADPFSVFFTRPL